MSSTIDSQGLEPHRRRLWAILYRLTGSATDAEDLVQETFLRAVERRDRLAPGDLSPWLTRVAVNLGKDQLRKRRRGIYDGPWLPMPVDAGKLEEVTASYEVELASGRTTEGRYDLLESVSFAFLVALEALTPSQRAVLLLRDVFDYTSAETADVLAISPASVKTTLHRARKAMAVYDASREDRAPEGSPVKVEALERFLVALASRDAAAVEAVFLPEATATTDAGGEFVAARKQVRGAGSVAKLILGIVPADGKGLAVDRVLLNGDWFLELTLSLERPAGRPVAPRALVHFDVCADGRVRAIHSVLASKKLVAC